jgi:hypothetical protein
MRKPPGRGGFLGGGAGPEEQAGVRTSGPGGPDTGTPMVAARSGPVWTSSGMCL